VAEARAHDVSALTVAELERVKRDLRVSMVLAMPGSPVRVTATAHLDAIDRELARPSRSPLRLGSLAGPEYSGLKNTPGSPAVGGVRMLGQGVQACRSCNGRRDSCAGAGQRD
jgi:hypothetical protein